MDLIGEAVAVIGRLRKALGMVLPDTWLRTRQPAGAGLFPRQPTPARMEFNPGAPAESWDVWEVCRGPGQSSGQGSVVRGDVSEPSEQ